MISLHSLLRAQGRIVGGLSRALDNFTLAQIPESGSSAVECWPTAGCAAGLPRFAHSSFPIRELVSLAKFSPRAGFHTSSSHSSSAPDHAPSLHRAVILDGRAVAAAWQDELALEVADVKARGGRPPGLGVILVGGRPDSQLYVTRKQEACERVGIYSVVQRLPESTTQLALRRAVRALCGDPLIDGVLVQLPLPGHIDEEDVIEHFDPRKDVDGFHPLNVGRTLMRGHCARFVPCTALGCMELLRRCEIDIAGKSVAIVGDSNIVGMPLAMLFRDEGAATVTVVHRSSYSSLFSDRGSGQTDRYVASALTKETPQCRANANACLPRTPGPHPRTHHREAQPYKVTYSSGMRDAYLPPSSLEDPASVPSHLSELAGITRTADILVVAVGYPHLVKEHWIKPGAVVIDVGINAVDWDYASAGHSTHSRPGTAGTDAEQGAAGGVIPHVEHREPDGEEHPHFHVVGDVDFEEAARVASAVTPVPGGVGPMTIAALLHNTVHAAAITMGLRKEGARRNTPVGETEMAAQGSE